MIYVTRTLLLHIKMYSETTSSKQPQEVIKPNNCHSNNISYLLLRAKKVPRHPAECLPAGHPLFPPLSQGRRWCFIVPILQVRKQAHRGDVSCPTVTQVCTTPQWSQLPSTAVLSAGLQPRPQPGPRHALQLSSTPAISSASSIYLGFLAPAQHP